MREYGQTFRRHLILYCLLPILAMVAVGYVVFSAPKKYESSAGLWVDNGPVAGSSISATAATTTGPASFEQGILSELLAINSFDLAVGRDSLLKNSVSGATAEARDNAIEAAVAAGAQSTTPGPQVLLISFTGGSPAIAQSTVSSLIRQLEKSTSRYVQDYGRTATSYYTTQLAAANAAQTTAKDALLSYQSAHPTATSATDPAYAQLSSALAAASTQVSSATQSLDQAQAEGKLGVTGATLRLADAPSLPTAPIKSKKKQAALVLIAGIGGALLSLLIVIALTKGDADPWESEVIGRTALLPVIGVSPEPTSPYPSNGHRTSVAVSEPAYDADQGVGEAKGEAAVSESQPARPGSLDVDAPRLRPKRLRSREDREPV